MSESQPNAVLVSVKMPRQLVAELDFAAHVRCMTRSEALRHIVEQWLQFVAFVEQQNQGEPTMPDPAEA